jgi:FtsZ-binding cell division protein ZapB
MNKIESVLAETVSTLVKTINSLKEKCDSLERERDEIKSALVAAELRENDLMERCVNWYKNPEQGVPTHTTVGASYIDFK